MAFFQRGASALLCKMKEEAEGLPLFLYRLSFLFRRDMPDQPHHLAGKGIFVVEPGGCTDLEKSAAQRKYEGLGGIEDTGISISDDIR